MSVEHSCRQGRGMQIVSSVSIVDATGLTDAADVDIIIADATDFIVVDALWFDYPTDVTAIHALFSIDDYFNGDRLYATVHESTALAAINPLFTWENPNPPTGQVQGIIAFSGVALQPGTTDKISVIGGDATAANNYNSTAGDPLLITARARKIQKDAFT